MLSKTVLPGSHEPTSLMSGAMTTGQSHSDRTAKPRGWRLLVPGRVLGRELG